MTLQERIMEDLKKAIKSGDTTRRDVIRFLRAAIQKLEIEQRRPLEDQEVITVLRKQINQRQEAIALFKQGNRQELADKETTEMKLLQEYLPPQLSEEVIAQKALGVIEEIGARGPSDIGKVMGHLMGQLRGQAEGQTVRRVVEELLANKK